MVRFARRRDVEDVADSGVGFYRGLDGGRGGGDGDLGGGLGMAVSKRRVGGLSEVGRLVEVAGCR